MREIEIKARVRDQQKLSELLTKAGVTLGEPVHQHDKVWGTPGKKSGDLDARWLRIRTENGSKSIFTLKRAVIGHLDSIEHETEVSNAEELEKIIVELGFEPYSNIEKTRRKVKIGDIEICYDDLKGLGVFVEAEKIMLNDADHEVVVKELWDLLESLGVSKKDEIHEGYDVLERKKRGLKD